MNLALCALLSTLIAIPALAAKTGPLKYTADGEKYNGYLAMPKQTTKKAPVVIIVHDWMGPSKFTKEKADALAKLGYIAFAADVYGDGKAPQDAKEAATLAASYKSDRALLQKHIKYAYDEVLKIPQIDEKKIVVMGFCFGGTTALELGRAGVKLAGIATFHGGLDNPTPENAKNIKAKVLNMHGAIDPHVPDAEVKSYMKEMNAAGVDYQFISYSGAVHSFTNPEAKDQKSGSAYNKAADKRSWQHFQDFLKEVAPT